MIIAQEDHYEIQLRRISLFGAVTSVLIAPRLCFELAKTTQHDFWSATQRGADYAEALQTRRCAYL